MLRDRHPIFYVDSLSQGTVWNFEHLQCTNTKRKADTAQAEVFHQVVTICPCVLYMDDFSWAHSYDPRCWHLLPDEVVDMLLGIVEPWHPSVPVCNVGWPLGNTPDWFMLLGRPSPQASEYIHVYIYIYINMYLSYLFVYPFEHGHPMKQHETARGPDQEYHECVTLPQLRWVPACRSYLLCITWLNSIFKDQQILSIPKNCSIKM